MRTHAAAAALGLALRLLTGGSTALAAQPANTPDFLLSPGKAGRFQVGDSVTDTVRRVGRDRVTLVDLQKEGHFSPAIQIRLPGSDNPSIVADVREWPCGDYGMWGISVRDPRFRTAEGLGVGSTVRDLRLAYSVRANHEEGQFVIVQTLKMSFAVDGDSEDDRSRVTSVWLWPDPDAVRLRRCPERR